MGGVAFLENVNFDGLIVISVKNASDRGETVRYRYSCTNRITLLYTLEWPPKQKVGNILLPGAAPFKYPKAIPHAKKES